MLGFGREPEVRLGGRDARRSGGGVGAEAPAGAPTWRRGGSADPGATGSRREPKASTRNPCTVRPMSELLSGLMDEAGASQLEGAGELRRRFPGHPELGNEIGRASGR